MNERVVHDPVVAPPPDIDVSGVETPAYIIDLGRLRSNLAILGGVQARAGCKILLALKGFAMWSVFPLVGEVLSGIVRSIGMFREVGLLRDPLHVSFVMGVASGMPAKASWLPLLVDELPEGAHFQTIAIGREEVWDLHRATVEQGGHVRTGLEDTFYMPDGSRATSNGQLVEALVRAVREGGREPATAAQSRALFGIA